MSEQTQTLTNGAVQIAPRTGTAFRVSKGQKFSVIDPKGASVADLVAFSANDPRESLSNLAYALTKFGIQEDSIPTHFNVFMNVAVDGNTGVLEIKPPLSKTGDHIDFIAEMDLIIGLTACSAPKTNDGSFKPIEYKLH
ncbi:hypothetical protein BFJ71_g7875 [Fusarium oxysporum]|nr:hypothetical protein BFJ71_g7875 [Fusarium oxysporum]